MKTNRISQLKSTLSTRSARKTATGVAIFLVVFSLTGFLIVPPILKSVLIDKLSAGLHRSVSIRQVRVNPFMLSATVRGVLIKDRNGQDRFISFDELYVNVQLMSIIKRGIVLSEVKLVSPHVTIIRNKDGSYNFSDLLESKPKAGGETTRFSLNNIQIFRGSIDFLDGPKDTRHTVTDMNIAIPFLSNLPHYVDIYTKPSFEATVNGTPVSFKGKTKPFKDSHETTFDIKFSGINIPFYLAYSPVAIPFRMRSGLLDTDAVLTYTQYTKKAPVLSLAGNVVLREINIADLSDAPILSFPALKIVFAPSDIVAKKIHLASVTLRSPRLNIARDKSGRINLKALLPEKGQEAKPADRERTPLSFDADRILMSDARVDFLDSSGPFEFKTALQGMELGIDNVSTAEGKKAHATFSFETEAKETVKAASDISINPFLAEGTVAVASVPLKKYAPYYSSRFLFDVEDGRLDFSTHYRIEKGEEGPHMAISALSAALSSLKLKKRGEKDDFLSIPSAEVKDLSADASQKELIIRELSTRDGNVKIRRDKAGAINVQSLLAGAPPPPHAVEKNGKEKAAEKKKEWLIKILDLSADGYAVKMEDLGQPEPVRMAAERIRLKCSDLSTARNAKGKASLSFVFNKKGSVATSGSVGVNPLAANMRLRLKGIALAPFQPYFADRLDITITGGSFSLAGAVSAAYASDGAVKASFKGASALTGFASVDKANGDDFLKWDALNLDGINASYAPLRLSIDKVALADFYSRLIINKDGSLNLQGVLKEQGDKANLPAQAVPEKPVTGPIDKAADTASSAKPPSMSRSSSGAEQKISAGGQAAVASHAQKPGKLITIEAVTLQGGTINFTDRHIEPNYSANMLEIGGRISGLSSEENKFADVELKGKLENYAPLQITGKINPLRDDLFVDLNVDFKDMDLSPVSPYSGRYAGYTIQKGRLAVSLKYLIVKKKLDAQNNILLDQFTFGDKVESPEATKLPVKFAVALLKNRKGEINLDIPVSGYIDDPKFSLGRIILKIIVNLLVKAATSPFALLGALFGHGDELSYVQFDYGLDDLSQPEMKKLDVLVKALSDRPALKLEIEGHVDKEKDKEGLKQYLFDKKIKAQKLKDMVKKGEPAVPVDEVQVGKEEYAKYLKMAYKEEKFPKPRNILGIAKDLPVPEMEKLMLTNLKVGDEELRQLASQRALRVKEYVIKSGQVTPDRVFLIEPKSLEPEKKEKLRDSRIDFRLK